MKLQDTRITPSKIVEIDHHACLAFAGLNADARRLVEFAQLEAQSQAMVLGEKASIEYLGKRIAEKQQSYTQSGGFRPFGVSTLVAGFDQGDDTPRLWHTEPSGIAQSWKSNAIGRSSKTVAEFLERNHKADMSREETIRLTIKSLLEVVQTGAKNIEIAIMSPGKRVELLPLEDIEKHVKDIEAEKQEEADKKKNKGRTPGTGQAAILTKGPGA